MLRARSSAWRYSRPCRRLSEEHVHGVGLAGAAEREGGLFGHLVGGGQELVDEGEGGAALQGDQGFQHLTGDGGLGVARSEEHTSELQSLRHLVCRLLLEK